MKLTTFSFYSTLAILLAGCASTERVAGCDYGKFSDLVGAGVSNLSFTFGASQLKSKPFISARTTDKNGAEQYLRLDLVMQSGPVELDFDQSDCPTLSWGTYNIDVEPAKWNAFVQPRTLRDLEIGIVFTEPGQSLTMSSIAFVIQERLGREVLWVCGCAKK